MEKELFCNTLLEGLIKKEMARENIRSINGFCRRFGFRSSEVGQLINLKISPLLKNGKYRISCQKLADHFFMEAQDLFPLELYDPEEDGFSEELIEIVPLNEKTESLRLDVDSGNDELELSELRMYLKSVLIGLSDQQKIVFLMHHILGFTLEEVGEQLGVTKQRIYLVNKTLKRRIKHYSRSRKLKEFY